MKKKKKINGFNEASATIAIKGYLASRKAFGNGEIYSKDKKKKSTKDKPWYMKSIQEIRKMIHGELTEQRILAEAGDMPSFDNHIQNLKKELSKVNKEIEVDKKKVALKKASGKEAFEDFYLRQKKREIKNQIKKLVQAKKLGGDEWRKFLIDPEGQKDISDKEKEKSSWKTKVRSQQDGDPKIKEFVAAVYPKIEQYYKVSPGDKTVSWVFDKFQKYLGKKQTSESELKNIEKFIKDILIDKFAKKASGSSSEEKLAQGTIDFIHSKQDQTKEPERPAGDQIKTKAGGGKRTAKGPGATGKGSDIYRKRISKEPMPGAIGDLQTLHRKTSAEPEYAKANLKEPQAGKGAAFDPGTTGKDLQQSYIKIVDGIIKTKFPELVKVVARKHGMKYSHLRDLVADLGDKFEGQGLEMTDDTLKMYFSPEEIDALGEISVLSDPREVAKLQSQGFTQFEDALGNYLRDLFSVRGYPIKTTSDEDSLDSQSGAVTDGMRSVLAVALKTDKANVDRKAAELRRENPHAWERIETAALNRLRDISSYDFKREMEARQNRDSRTKDYLKRQEKKAKAVDPRLKHADDFRSKDKEYAQNMAAMDRIIARREKEAADKEQQGLFNQRENKMSKNESLKISILELFEGFENSYDIDTDEKEKEWENGKPAAKKDWKKELSLESLMRKLHESELEKRSKEPMDWLDNEDEAQEELRLLNTPDGWGKGNEPDTWQPIGKHAGRLPNNERE